MATKANAIVTKADVAKAVVAKAIVTTSFAIGLLKFVYVFGVLSFASNVLAADETSHPNQDRVTSVTKNAEVTKAKDSFKVMAWNIWHGGREDGKEIGPKRVIEIIKDSKADIVAMQETYGSGEIISKGLGFHFLPRGTNLSIHSRYRIIEDISVFEKFKCVGALIELPTKEKLAFYCIWLPYGKDIWLNKSREGLDKSALQKACEPSAKDLRKIHAAIEKRLSAKKYADVSVMISGDFNSMSHLDYGESSTDQYESPIAWATSQILVDAGFRDSYRETNPVVDRKVDSTWTPRFPEQEQDRIDFIYYKSKNWKAKKSYVIQNHKVKFPSDHAALVTEFEPKTVLTNKLDLRTVSYNIKRGYGNDGKTDISRSIEVLRKLGPDFIGLQEVDYFAKRSGEVNQPKEFSKALNMHAAFGPFMNFQGGKYGMAVLSKHPIQQVTQVKLPTGNEPRVALAVKVLLPDGSSLVLVNVHFDWVRDDKFRFAQAQSLKKYLDALTDPYLLMGDFNDQRGSRTLNLLSKDLLDPKKPAGDKLTFSATNPTVEIDFVFANPKQNWTVKDVKVIDEKVASDHRPVLVDFSLELGK